MFIHSKLELKPARIAGMLSSSPETLGYAFLGGLLPALLWLYFLLKEDGRCPEPRWLVFMAFMVGMASVLVVLPLEHWARSALPVCTPGAPGSCVPLITAWATIEETVKYVLAAIFILWRRVVKQWTHLVTAMLTVALGFAALENALFLIEPIAGGNIMESFVTGNLRFVGATLLHVVASSAIGFALAFSYMKRPTIRAAAASLGLILAIALHALFNFFIIREDGAHALFGFFVVWTGAIAFFAAFEVLKWFKYRNLPKNTC